MANITILGSGGFGLSLAIMCDNAGHEIVPSYPPLPTSLA